MDVNKPIVDKQVACLEEFDRRLRAKLPSLIKQQDLAVHAQNPVALHSDDLKRVLTYVRSQPIAGKLAVVRLDGFNDYGIVRLSGSRSEPAQILPEPRFKSLAEASHYILLRRIEALRGGTAVGGRP